MKFSKAAAGSVSIFLILVLLPLYTCIYMAIDSVRVSAAKARLTGAMNLTGNAALNSYDIALKELYGLFAMGTSEGKFETEMAAVFSGTVDSSDTGGAEGRTYENMLSTRTQTFELTFPGEASMARPEVLEQRITDYMKYRAPYNFALGMVQRLGVFSSLTSSAAALEKAGDYYKALEGVSKELESISKSLPGTGTEFDPGAEENRARRLKSRLASLDHEVKKTEKKAADWKNAINSMDNGEAKSLLAGDCKGTADVLSRQGIDNLTAAIDSDIAALKLWEEGQPEPELTYLQDPLYKYIQASARTAAADDEKSAAAEEKAGLEYIAGTKTEKYISGLDGISVSTLAGFIGADIDSIGSAAAVSAEGGVSGTDTKSSIKAIKSFFPSLTGKTDSLMSESFAEEYINGMFSCYTTNALDTNMAGAAFGGKPLFHGETEYILFGKDSLKANVMLAADLVFAVRFMLNSLYAFSNVRMRAEAMTAASAISGWTGAGVVLVQNLLLTLWASAEAVLDTASLLKGESVPIYKSEATWTLSLAGVSGKVQQGVENFASSRMEDIFQKIRDTADDKLDEISGQVVSSLEKSADGAAESLTNMIVAPVESTVTELIGDKTHGISGYSRDDIRARISKAVSSADNGSSGYKIAKNLFDSYCLEHITDVIYSNYANLFADDDTLSKAAAQAVENAVRGTYTELKKEVSGVVKNYTAKAHEKVDSAIGSAQDKIRENMISAIEDYTGRIGELLGSSVSPQTSSVSSYAGLSMSYRDYLRVFTFVGLLSKSTKRGMMTRAAKVMQINGKKQEAGFNICRCFTQVSLSAHIGISGHRLSEEEIYAY